MAINTGRLIVSGLVSGVVGNVIDGVANSTVMAPEMQDLTKRFGMDPAMAQSFAAAVPWIVVDFIFGFVMIFTYVAIRPRFGAGPKTAMIAAFLPFLATSAVVYGFTSMGMMSMPAFWTGTFEALVSTQIAALAGAALYKE